LTLEETGKVAILVYSDPKNDSTHKISPNRTPTAAITYLTL